VSGGDSKRPSQAPVGLTPPMGVMVADPHRDLAGALHDVSNALTVMLGWVQESRAEHATRESVAYALGIIEQRARIARDLARRAIGAGSKILDQDGHLDVTLRDAIDALAVMAQRVGVRVRLVGMTPGVKIPAAGDVSQIVTNLVMNALAYAPANSEVTVSLDGTTDRTAVIDVTDQGAGVAPTRRDSIFEGDSKREGGAGVGLRHARALARALGGDVELLAEPQGARFRVSWPRLDGLPKPPQSVARIRVLEGTRVLILEDDGDVTDLLEASLGARGAEVTVVRSHADLAGALTKPHDAALIDLSPIAGNVRAAFDALRMFAPNARLVIMTGNAEGLPPEVSADTVRLVRKPFEVSEIVAALLEPRTKA
jgi:CheY-like chemotaxis protein